MSSSVAFTAAFVAALVLGTLVEYVGHRLMHSGAVLRRRHARHHRLASGQDWLGEFRDYFVPTLLIVWIGFIVSRPAGFGFAAGDLLYAGLAAYSHQLQHERPELCFWMPKPVHRAHHDGQMWEHNFGILVDWWDRALGTYKTEGISCYGDWRTHAPHEWLEIHWLSRPQPADRVERGGRSQPTSRSSA